MGADRTSTKELLRVIQAEYREMPGLDLTRAQAQRLWGLDAHTCTAMFETLVAVRFLRCNDRQAYVLAGSSH
jgi:hypothetical protein